MRAGSETTFETDLLDTDRIEAEVAALADKVFSWCERAGELGAQLITARPAQ